MVAFPGLREVPVSQTVCPLHSAIGLIYLSLKVALPGHKTWIDKDHSVPLQAIN